MQQISLPAGRRDLDDIVGEITGSTRVLAAIKALPSLVETAREVDPAIVVPALEAVLRNRMVDPLAAYLATHALGEVDSAEASMILSGLLDDPDPALREHAAWALSKSRPNPEAVAGLAVMAHQGGFAKMMAELALETWFKTRPDLASLVDDYLASRLLRLERPTPSPSARRSAGLRIAQVLMQGRVDAGLTAAASGDGGGLTTLQVGLTRELSRHPGVSESYLLTRRIQGDAPVFAVKEQRITDGSRISRLDFGPRGYLTRDEMWEHRADLERELRGFFSDNGPFDVVHLRFADVGTFAAARVARELGIRIAFTLAPDPHAVIDAAEKTGDLTRANYADWERDQHFLFRAWLVSSMLEDADRLVLLPRREQRRQFLDLLDVDILGSDRFVSIPEGVDFAELKTAADLVTEPTNAPETPTVILELREAVSALPESRKGLPLLLSAGRLSTVKGMDRVVAAWAGDDHIHDRFNLVIVGGDLANPSEEERAVLSSIEDAREEKDGLILLGSRSHRDVALLMAAASAGIEPHVEPNGIYVSGSAKEEFGLAIVEAMGSGLAVIAPRVGGPATYIDHCFTGYLADTLDPEDIRAGIGWASGARHSEIRADAARRLVRTGYSLAAMAEELVASYHFENRKVPA